MQKITTLPEKKKHALVLPKGNSSFVVFCAGTLARRYPTAKNHFCFNSAGMFRLNTKNTETTDRLGWFGLAASAEHQIHKKR